MGLELHDLQHLPSALLDSSSAVDPFEVLLRFGIHLRGMIVLVGIGLDCSSEVQAARRTTSSSPSLETETL